MLVSYVCVIVIWYCYRQQEQDWRRPCSIAAWDFGRGRGAAGPPRADPGGRRRRGQYNGYIYIYIYIYIHIMIRSHFGSSVQPLWLNLVSVYFPLGGWGVHESKQ